MSPWAIHLLIAGLGFVVFLATRRWSRPSPGDHGVGAQLGAGFASLQIWGETFLFVLVVAVASIMLRVFRDRPRPLLRAYAWTAGLLAIAVVACVLPLR